MNQKRSALILLLLISLLLPIVEMLSTGKIEILGKFAALHGGLSALAIYWWYYLDKQQLGFRSGVFQNIGMLALSFVALPVYFIRSRGWKIGSIWILKSIGFLVVMSILSILGEFTAREIAF